MALINKLHTSNQTVLGLITWWRRIWEFSTRFSWYIGAFRRESRAVSADICSELFRITQGSWGRRRGPRGHRGQEASNPSCCYASPQFLVAAPWLDCAGSSPLRTHGGFMNELLLRWIGQAQSFTPVLTTDQIRWSFIDEMLSWPVFDVVLKKK